MSLLNCEIYQRGRVSTVADTELILTIVQLIVRRMSWEINNKVLTRETKHERWKRLAKHSADASLHNKQQHVKSFKKKIIA